jgi:hypothetical protein
MDRVPSPRSLSLKQPWKAWYKKMDAKDTIDQFSDPKPINGRTQGSLPQKPRQVDFSAEKTN